MSTEIETKLTGHSVTRYWGGKDKGVCLQITNEQNGYIQLNIEDAATLANELCAFVREEAKRRRELLKKQISKLQLAEKTVFHEIIDIPDDVFATSGELSITTLVNYCPISLDGLPDVFE